MGIGQTYDAFRAEVSASFGTHAPRSWVSEKTRDLRDKAREGRWNRARGATQRAGNISENAFGASQYSLTLAKNDLKS